MNKFKILSVILMTAIVVLSVSLYNKPEKETYTFGEVEIEKGIFNSLVEAVGTDRFNLCSIEDNKCVLLSKINP